MPDPTISAVVKVLKVKPPQARSLQLNGRDERTWTITKPKSGKYRFSSQSMTRAKGKEWLSQRRELRFRGDDVDVELYFEECKSSLSFWKWKLPEKVIAIWPGHVQPFWSSDLHYTLSSWYPACKLCSEFFSISKKHLFTFSWKMWPNFIN